MEEESQAVGGVDSAQHGSTTPVCRRRPLRRTPQGFSKLLGAKFKSPVPRVKAAAWQGDKESLRREMDSVRDRTAAVDLEIGQLTAQGCSPDELDVHIRKLHDYNELKDAAQSLLGQLVTTDSMWRTDRHH
uniref:DNA repair protein SWI5 homolog n=1 Tax=Petromyzon marinus TaxID=7757 RepID=A0AAJ7UHL7_PETMA|nr:DNA repair protein SWI5 homolog isoform X2 [Petromyzon marinus]